VADRPFPLHKLEPSVADALAEVAGNRIGVLDGEAIGLPDDLPPWIRGEVVKAADGNGWFTVPLSGTAAGPREGNPPQGIVNPWRAETFNITRQIAITRQSPELAAQLEAEAAL
jgi:hypothetical protein